MLVNRLDINLVRTPDQQQQAFAVRTLVYVGEQRSRWNEEFDGNDVSATHLIGCMDGEPVATARIRWFGTFAKLERLALRAEFRGNGFGHQMVQYMIALCETNGYRTLYIHSQERLQHFYANYGFEQVGDRFFLFDRAYIRMVSMFDANTRNNELSSRPRVFGGPDGARLERTIPELPELSSVTPEVSHA